MMSLIDAINQDGGVESHTGENKHVGPGCMRAGEKAGQSTPCGCHSFTDPPGECEPTLLRPVVWFESSQHEIGCSD